MFVQRYPRELDNYPLDACLLRTHKCDLVEEYTIYDPLSSHARIDFHCSCDT